MTELRDLEADRRWAEMYERINVSSKERKLRTIAIATLDETERLKRLLVKEWLCGGFVVTAVHFREPPIGGTECCDSNGRIYWWFKDDKSAWAAVRKAALK